MQKFSGEGEFGLMKRIQVLAGVAGILTSRIAVIRCVPLLL
jgi:hypothetical protein